MKSQVKIVHCLTVDVEGFAEGMAESFPIRQEYFEAAATDREIELNVNEVLAGFSACDVMKTKGAGMDYVAVLTR